jgi:hypothetical protein
MNILFIAFNYNKVKNIFKIINILYYECIYNIDLKIKNKNDIFCGYSNKKIIEMKENGLNVDKVEDIFTSLLYLFDKYDKIIIFNENLFKIFQMEVKRKINKDISSYNNKIISYDIHKEYKYKFNSEDIDNLMELFMSNNKLVHKKKYNEIISNINTESNSSEDNIQVYLPINVSKIKKIKTDDEILKLEYKNYSEDFMDMLQENENTEDEEKEEDNVEEDKYNDNDDEDDDVYDEDDNDDEEDDEDDDVYNDNNEDDEYDEDDDVDDEDDEDDEEDEDGEDDEEDEDDEDEDDEEDKEYEDEDDNTDDDVYIDDRYLDEYNNINKIYKYNFTDSSDESFIDDIHTDNIILNNNDKSSLEKKSLKLNIKENKRSEYLSKIIIPFVYALSLYHILKK